MKQETIDKIEKAEYFIDSAVYVIALIGIFTYFGYTVYTYFCIYF